MKWLFEDPVTLPDRWQYLAELEQGYLEGALD
jgi:hypothetical protein